MEVVKEVMAAVETLKEVMAAVISKKDKSHFLSQKKLVLVRGLFFCDGYNPNGIRMHPNATNALIERLISSK